MDFKKYCLVIIFLINIIACTSPTWTNHSPNIGGRLSAIVASPTDANTLIVASPGGGIWRTINGGVSWTQPLNYSLADFSVVDLQWDRIRNGRLYASTYSDLYSSTDLGDHWSNLTHFGGIPGSLFPNFQGADPKPFAQLRYSSTTSTIFWSKSGGGLFYSDDGATFTQHFPFPGEYNNPDNYIQSIAADDATGRVYFSTMAEDLVNPGHIFRSTCAWAVGAPCLTWESVNTGIPVRSEIKSIAYGGVANRLALVLNNINASTTEVYKSMDGVHWVATLTQPPDPKWDPRILTSPAPNQLLLSTIWPYVSNDWGDTWTIFNYPGMHPDFRSFYWGSFAGNSYLWSTTDGSSESGTYTNISRWNFIPGSTPNAGTPVGINGLKVWQTYFMAVTGMAGGARKRIFLGSQDNGCLVSDDGGITWTSAGAPPGNGCLDYASLVFAPNNPDRAYARTCDGLSFVRSDNAFTAATSNLVTWTTISPPSGNYLPLIWTNAMTAIDPTNADRICIARNINVGISVNAGANWDTHILPGNANPVSVYIDSDHAIYVGTISSGIFRSVDNGVTWTAFGLNGSGIKAILKIVHSTAGGAGGTFYAATSVGLYRKLPGSDFQYVAAGGDASYVVTDVEIDPVCASRIYICKGFLPGYIQHRGGILLSTDNGTTFTSITSGLDIHQAPISDIQVDPVSSRYLHAAVFGLGAWTYDAGTIPVCN